MDGETLDRVNRDITQDKPYNKIGINNIRERIHLQFGDQATLVYSSEVGRGVVATLRFPFSENQAIS
jgi:LytS/YehU family sensor histidine kinase